MGGFNPQSSQAPMQMPGSPQAQQDISQGFNQSLGMHPAEFLAKVLHHLASMSPKAEEKETEKKE